MRQAVSLGIGALCCLLGTGCAAIIHEAVQRDITENAHVMNSWEAAGADDGEPPRVCPPDKIQKEDCRVIPCKVTCEDRKDLKP